MDSKSPADKEMVTSSHKLYKEATRKRQGQTSYSREAPSNWWKCDAGLQRCKKL